MNIGVFYGYFLKPEKISIPSEIRNEVLAASAWVACWTNFVIVYLL